MYRNSTVFFLPVFRHFVQSSGDSIRVQSERAGWRMMRNCLGLGVMSRLVTKQLAIVHCFTGILGSSINPAYRWRVRWIEMK